MTETAKAAQTNKQDETSKTGAEALLLKVLGAIGTGIGVLGFVAFFGGAVLWLRADQADLPANDAISAVPNSVLVTTGASFLVPALLIALLAVTFIFTVYAIANFRRRKSARTARKEADELWKEVDQLRDEATTKTGEAKGTREALAAASGEAAANLLTIAQAQTTAEVEAARQLEKKEATAREREGAAEGKPTQTAVQLRIELWVGFAAVLVFPLIFNKAIFSLDLVFAGVILILVALGAAAISAVVYLSTEKLVWFGVAAFVTIGIYIGFATYYSTTRNPKIEPAAALRGERAPLVGSFIADTASNLYLGTFPEDERRPHLIVVPRAQVTSLTIGPLTDPDNAPGRAIAMALGECRQRVDVPKSKDGPAQVKQACTAGQRSTLEAQLGK